MKSSTEEQNQALVLRAFDTPFNKRDYAAAERFCPQERPWRVATTNTIVQ